MPGRWLHTRTATPGWEFGGELIYQDSQDISADGGSSAAIDSDVGIALTFGYRVSERLVVNFGIDWNNVDYEATLVDAELPEYQRQCRW